VDAAHPGTDVTCALAGHRRHSRHGSLDRAAADQPLLWDFLDSYLLALEDGQWRILGDAVHA
jgi:hypothetical protein